MKALVPKCGWSRRKEKSRKRCMGNEVHNSCIFFYVQKYRHVVFQRICRLSEGEIFRLAAGGNDRKGDGGK